MFAISVGIAMSFKSSHLGHRNIFTWSVILTLPRSLLECHPTRYVVSRERHPVRYLIAPAAHPDRYVVAPEVFLILMWSHLERRPDRYAVAPGASSWSLSDLTCSVILTATRSHPACHPKRHMLASRSQAKNSFRGSHHPKFS